MRHFVKNILEGSVAKYNIGELKARHIRGCQCSI